MPDIAQLPSGGVRVRARACLPPPPVLLPQSHHRPGACHKGSSPGPDPGQNPHSDKTPGDCVLSGRETHSL